MNILYLSYSGLAEPLGQSQILAYLRGLSSRHRITLVTFEKPADLADVAAINTLKAACAEHGIRWVARRYHHRPRLSATALDLAVLGWTALRQARAGEAELIHARGYIPAFVALLVKRRLDLPFIFDMRALWPEEMVTAGRLRRQSLLFQLLGWSERLCLRKADAVVSLTEAAAGHLRREHGGNLAPTRVSVIPTCVDLDRFGRDPARTAKWPPAIGSIGSVLSGWFQLDWLMAFFGACTGIWPEARFTVVTRDAPAKVAAAAAVAGIGPGRLTVEARTTSEMPQALARLDAVAMFFAPAISEIARCPTRMGEALAAGLPVIANDGVGDVAGIIRRHDVGVVVADASEPSMRRAARDLGRLLDDPLLPGRCRRAAEACFSLKAGVEAYHALYSEIAAPGAAGSG